MSVQYHNADPVELEGQFRAAADGSSVFEGYAAIFGQRSKPIRDELAQGNRPYVETITAGAYRRTLGSGKRQSFVVDHNERMMIASAPGGALRLSEDSKGLHVESPWPRTDYADNVRALHDAGEKLAMSQLFATPANGDAWDRTGPTHSRMVNEAILKHVSVLATMEPAYSGTSASFRALDDLAGALLADRDALAAAIDKLANGEPLTPMEADLLESAIEYLEPPAPMDMEVDGDGEGQVGRAALDRWAARLAEMEAALPA
jgi:HK97 family phage prohead protease